MTVTAEPTPSEDAESQLESLRGDDLARADLSTTQWAAQLNSKTVGMVIDGQTITAGDILGGHQGLVTRFSSDVHQVLLLQSTDVAPYDTYHGDPLWMTVAVNGWTSKAQVQRWCHRSSGRR